MSIWTLVLIFIGAEILAGVVAGIMHAMPDAPPRHGSKDLRRPEWWSE